MKIQAHADDKSCHWYGCRRERQDQEEVSALEEKISKVHRKRFCWYWQRYYSYQKKLPEKLKEKLQEKY